MRTYLEPRFTNQLSFYNKATVEEVKSGYRLYSYGTLIAELVYQGDDDFRLRITEYWGYSNTTLKHLKEFIKQNVYYNDKVNGTVIFPKNEEGYHVDKYENCLTKSDIKKLIKDQPHLI